MSVCMGGRVPLFFCIVLLGACRAYLGQAQRDDDNFIVGKKEDELKIYT